MNTIVPGPLLADPASGLSYRLLPPSSSSPRRCLVLLHGVGSNEQAMADVGNFGARDTLVVLVQGPLPLGPQRYAFFQVDFTADGPRIVPEQAESSRLALIRLLASLQQAYGIRPSDTTLAGFSQGGIMSAGVALTSPESLGSFGLLSGRILPEIAPAIATPDRLARLQGFVGHGQLDDKLPVAWAHRSQELLDRLGVKHRFSLYPAGHTISQAMHEDFVQWWSELAEPSAQG